MKNFSLGTISKNLAFLVIVAVLPALAILLYTGIEQRRTSIEAAKREVLLLTSSMTQAQDDMTRSCRQILSTLALLSEVQSLDIKASSKIFAAVMKENPVIHNISLTDLNGTVLTAGTNFKTTNLADRKHFKDALARNSFAAGEFIVARLGSKVQMFPFAYPVLDETGQPKAVLTTAVTLNRFTDFYDAATLPEKSFVAVTDHQGTRLLYYPVAENTNPVGKPIKAGVWELANDEQEPGLFTRAGSDGQKRIIAFQPLRLDPGEKPYMYMWAGIPEAPILAAANQILTRNLLLMLLATLLAFLIAWKLGKKRLILPIKNLVTMSQQIAEGKLATRSELVKQPDEFATLTSAFHEMANALEIGRQNQQENEARFRIVMDSLNAPVYVADMDSYEVLFINEYSRKAFGDIVGKTCWKTLQVEQTGPCSFCTNKYLLDEHGQPGEPHVWEFQNTVTGDWFFIHDRAIRWIDGRIVRLEIATNITKRKLAETKLAEESERLAVTLRSIAEGVITTNTEGQIVLINRVAESLTGWRQNEAVGRPLVEVFKVVDEKTGRPFESPVEKLISGNTIGQMDQTVLIDKHGRKKQIADSGAPLRDKDGNIIGAVLIFRDITEQLRTEKELLKVKKLESVGVLAGGIAHDFNNILAAILGNIDLSLRDAELSEKTERRLKQAQTASFRARDLTQQLLTFAKGGQPVKETASLVEVVKDSAEFILHGDKVACHFDFPDDLWLVDIDKGQVSQVIQNIILNASHAMSNGGQVELSGKNIDASELQNLISGTAKSYVKLDIKDTGIGIPASVLDKIFDPYFTTKQQGSGLGLAITHSIINKHGGSISVQSTPDVGTTFSIYLPASAESSLPSKKEPPILRSTKKARILVMDDEEIVRSIAEEMLGEMGHEVLFAADGNEAIACYRNSLQEEKPIDLLLMDLTIPGGLGGKEALEEILTMDDKARAIVSSGYSSDPIMADCEEYGFVAAIAKPYQFAELNRVISDLLA